MREWSVKQNMIDNISAAVEKAERMRGGHGSADLRTLERMSVEDLKKLFRAFDVFMVEVGKIETGFYGATSRELTTAND